MITMAEDRGRAEIAQLLKQSLEDPKLTREWGDTGRIHYGKSDTQWRFQELVDRGRGERELSYPVDSGNRLRGWLEAQCQTLSTILKRR
jgi:hypothetical protein